MNIGGLGIRFRGQEMLCTQHRAAGADFVSVEFYSCAGGTVGRF